MIFDNIHYAIYGRAASLTMSDTAHSRPLTPDLPPPGHASFEAADF
jgi:hypothetical protein